MREEREKREERGALSQARGRDGDKGGEPRGSVSREAGVAGGKAAGTNPYCAL